VSPDGASESGCLDWGVPVLNFEPLLQPQMCETERSRFFWPFGGCAHKGWPWILNMISREWSLVIEASFGWSLSVAVPTVRPRSSLLSSPVLMLAGWRPGSDPDREVRSVDGT